MKTLLQKMEGISACDPECKGRCEYCPDEVMREAQAKIKSDAKVIAALREALKDNLELLDRATSGYIGGCRLDMDWNKSRDEVIEETKLLLATFEQTAGESK